MQRRVLGWQIRWIAGLFSLLMVAAGANPSYADQAADQAEGARCAWTTGAPCSSADGDRVTHADPCRSSLELLGAKTLAEVEIEEEHAGASSSSALSMLLRVRGALDRACHAEREPSSTDGSGRLAPRAPPGV